MRRLAVFVGALLVLLLAAEGALSLLARRSLRELLPGGASSRGFEPGRRPHTAQPQAEPKPPSQSQPSASSEQPSDVDSPSDTATSSSDAGAPAEDETLDDAIFAVHEDPLVGYVLKRNANLVIYEGAIHSDALGLRRPPGPPPPQDALRVVVLGDSIAFGFGVNDDECLAARLEARLAELRGPQEPPVACRTVAIPSWNHRAAPAFLLDHWDELRPDLVLYLPCRNDVCDTDSATAEGKRRIVPDVSSADPWLSISVRNLVHGDAKRQLVGQGGELEAADLGQDALFSDDCAESRRRHDESAQSLARLHRLLAQRGCRLAVVWNTLSDYTWSIGSRLAQLAPDLPALALFSSTRPEFTLGFDAHPNAETLDVWARWLAAELVERGWVSRGAGHALPEVPEDYTELRGTLPEPGELERRAADVRQAHRRLLRPEIDFRKGYGLLQVLGGLNPNRTAREHLAVILAPVGRALELRLEPLAVRLDLYPLEVQVQVNGVSVGSVTLRADAVLDARLPLPEGLDRSQPLEVRLLPERWIVHSFDEAPDPSTPGSMSITWCRPVRIATSP